MPAGIPTATFAIGVAGAKNAALFAAAIFAATGDKTIAKNLNEFRANQTKTIMAGTLPQMSDIEAQQD
jgi:5-(carboxyamino)imidazole ribonucleotide mutase